MEKNKQTKKVFAILIFAVVLLNLNFVNGLSVGFGSAVNMEPGQSVEKSFTLMNKGANAGDIVVEASIEKGSEYITFTQGTRYEVPAGEIKPVPAVFKIPANAKSGDTYPVIINFNTIEGGGIGGGTIEFNVGYSLSFDINVLEKVPTTSGLEEPASASGSNMFIVWILIILVVLLILVFFIYRKMGSVNSVPVKARKR